MNDATDNLSISSSCSSWSSTVYPNGIFDSGSDDDQYSSTPGSQASPSLEPPTTLYWVRVSALRNHDNEAFSTAISDPGMRFRAVIVIDPWYTCIEGKKKLGLNRLRFLLESLHDIDDQLREYGTSLYVVKGHPLASLERVCNQWNVKKIVFQADREVRSNIVEPTVERLAQSMDIEILKFQGHTLYDTDRVVQSLNHPITSVKEFAAILPLLGAPAKPCDTPHPPDLGGEYEREEVPHEYSIPTLADFGYPSSVQESRNRAWVGGEREALRRLDIYVQRRKEPKEVSIDDLINPTALSPYIRFGCLSVRYFLFRVKELVKADPSFEFIAKEVTSKLLQREFYFTVLAQVPNFDQFNNAICVQLPWEHDELLLRSWREGCTGYPWIDATMRQLHEEGWIHHCQRESVAIFLTRGDLWQSWEEGKKVFQELLLDFEPGVSSGCWMKSSCSAFITGPVEHYCPVTFGKKLDPHGEYIRRYLPQLQFYPDEYIFAPWLAPASVQEAARCRVGVDYPNPIVDHKTAGVLCCEKLRSVMSMLQQFHNFPQLAI